MSFAPGLVGRAFSFATTNDWIRLPHDPSVFAQTTGTVEFWTKIFSLSESTVRLFSVAETGKAFPNANTWAVDYRGGGAVAGAIQVNLVAGGNIVMSAFTPANTIADTNWHHIAVIADGTDPIQVFVDGAAQPLTGVFGTTADRFFGHAINANVMAIGAMVRETVYAEGAKQIDELSTYNRALSSDEIASIYAAGSAGKAPYPGLVATPVADGVLVSWPAAAAGYQLVTRVNVEAGTWETVTNAPLQNGARWEVHFPASNSQRFFRLKSGD